MTSGRKPAFCHNMRSSLSRNDDVGFSKSETCSVRVGVLTWFLLGFPGQQLLKNPEETFVQAVQNRWLQQAELLYTCNIILFLF